MRLGRLFSGLGGVGRVLFFRSFVVFFGLVLWALLCSLRLLLWLLPLACLPCVRCSLGLWSSAPQVAGLLFQPAWLLRVLPSLLLSLGAGCAVGRSPGRSLRWWLAPGVFLCCRVVLPLLASSFLCFLSFF